MSGLARELRAELERLGAPRAVIDPATVKVMKPETREQPFSKPGWVFELKYDGFRVIAAGGQGEARLFYRSGLDATRILPELARAVAALPFASLILDGEAVVLDAAGKPDFQSLQRRGMRTRSIDAERAAAATPATFFVFDLLACEGFDLRPLPLSARKAMLRRILAVMEEGPIQLSDEIAERGEELYAAVVAMGLEGIVAKKADSPYRAGYSADWFKVRVDRASDFAVVGFDPVPRSRSGFRALHLAVCDAAGGLRYAGTVGTGFNREHLTAIRARLEPARRDTPPVAVAAGRGPVWVEPELVVEVRYKEWTAGGHLRHPVFLRVRDDKTVAECLRPGEDEVEEVEDVEQAPAESNPAAGSGERPPVTFTNLGKVFWPAEGYTKGDLVDYYRAVAPWMLPFLRDRPLVLDRYPDGITGKSFYQKNAPATAAGRVRTVAVRGEGSGREIDYFLCDDAESLLYLVNLGAIPFHVWSSRVQSLDRPDWCILDLDPKTAPFAHVVEIARAIRELCGEIEIESFVKTSGGSGLHVLLPMGRLFPHEQTRQLAELLARVIVTRLPKIATTARAIPARGGRVYVDALQNGRGKLLAAPYTARPRPGATVSTPLDWSEVDERLDVGAFNVKTVPQRLSRRKQDPLLPILTREPNLARTLELLAERF
ncbi:MAG: bifunctional non-ous end joining protein LigD [Acidobacteriota bacterium]|nr:bifunctional non-ous end joining protein LigD [Acidobacteriota bacterium]